MTAGTYDLTIEQNATFQISVFWTTSTTPPVPINVTGYTAKMQIRPAVGDPTVLATLTTSNGGIIMGDTDGKITLYMSDSTTLAFTWVTGVYDLDVVSPTGFVTRLLEGNVTVSQAVTTLTGAGTPLPPSDRELVLGQELFS